MKLKENKRMSLIVFTIILGVLVIVAIGIIVYLLNNPVKEKVAVQNPIEVAQLNSSSEVKEKYTNTLTDAQNGKTAFIELESKGGLQTEKHDGYYTYVDPFENKYNIKEIKDVVSEKGMMGTDNWAALFKVTIIYVDNNNQTKTMVLAIVLLPNHEVQNMGTYDNYTGSTSFVRSFSDLYEEDKDNNSTSVALYSDKEKNEIKETIENYYKLISAKENSPVLMLTDVMKLKVYAVQDPDYAPSNYIEHPNSNKYAWTGIKYKDFENNLWYISENLLKTNFPEFVEYKDYLYVEDNDINVYNFKYEIIKQEILDQSTQDTCICNVTVKNLKTGNTFTNKIKMGRGNGDFVIVSVDKV